MASETAPDIAIRHAEESDQAHIAGFDEMGGNRQQEIASGCCLVAEQHDQVVAYASYQPAGLLGQPLLTYLCVAPAMRGQGIAKQLVETIQAGQRENAALLH